jgi:hypothetical protein
MEVQAAPFNFSLRFGTVPGRCGHVPSPEPREKIKNPGSERPHYFLKRSTSQQLAVLATNVLPASCRPN